jgi:integrase
MTRRELQFDAEGKPVSWLLPSARSKNGRALFLPLSPLAVELITEALALAGEGECVFPSRVNGGDPIAGHALTTAMRRLGAALPDSAPGADTWRADVPTCHDLRRTAASRLAAAGTPTEDISAILNHVASGVTAKHYSMYDRAAEKARALSRWSQALGAILTPPEPNIITLRR